MKPILLSLSLLGLFVTGTRAQGDGDPEPEEEDYDVGLAFALVTAAGLSTTFGAALVFWQRFVNLQNTKFLGAALGFAGGVMLYVSFFEILQEAIDAFHECECLWNVEDLSEDDEDGAAILMGTLMFGLGVIITYLLDALVHCIFEQDGTADLHEMDIRGNVHHHHHHHHSTHHSKIQDPEEREKVRSFLENNNNMVDRRDRGTKQKSTAEGEALMGEGEISTANPIASVELDAGPSQVENGDEIVDEESQNSEYIKADQKQLRRMGLLTALAISLHNFPEGLATFAGTLEDTKIGVALAVAIGIHNIPEGICVSMPIYYATGSRWKGFWYAFWSGVSEIIGAALGYAFLVNILGPASFGVLLGIVAGIMITIVIKELLPTAHRYDPGDSLVTTSVMIGMAVMGLSIVLFDI